MTTTTEANLRKFMRDCQQFWQRQWYLRNGMPCQFSYDKAASGVALDMKAVIDTPNVYFATPGDTISEEDVRKTFNSEFSEDYDKCKEMFANGILFTVIPNGDVTYRNGGFDAILEEAKKMSNN